MCAVDPHARRARGKCWKLCVFHVVPKMLMLSDVWTLKLWFERKRLTLPCVHCTVKLLLLSLVLLLISYWVDRCILPYGSMTVNHWSFSLCSSRYLFAPLFRLLQRWDGHCRCFNGCLQNFLRREINQRSGELFRHLTYCSTVIGCIEVAQIALRNLLQIRHSFCSA